MRPSVGNAGGFSMSAIDPLPDNSRIDPGVGEGLPKHDLSRAQLVVGKLVVPRLAQDARLVCIDLGALQFTQSFHDLLTVELIQKSGVVGCCTAVVGGGGHAANPFAVSRNRTDLRPSRSTYS